jgi:hypothetical protein
MPHIKSLCGRAMMLNRGQLVVNGSPGEVTEMYAQQQDERSQVPQLHASSGMRILRTTLLDASGNNVMSVNPGQPVIFEIEYGGAGRGRLAALRPRQSPSVRQRHTQFRDRSWNPEG